MAEFHFPIPGSPDEKQIVIFVRRHWAAFLGQAIMICLILLIPIVLVIVLLFRETALFTGLSRNFLVLGLSAYYLIALTYSFMAWLSFYYDIYIITINAIIDINQHGFFERRISQLSLLRVQDTTSNIRGLFPTLFGYGNVLVETAGEQSQTFLLESVPNPQEISSKIQELHNQLIEVEGRRHQVLEGEGALAPGEITKIVTRELPEQVKPEVLPEPAAPEPVPSGPVPSEPEPKIEEGEINKNKLDEGGSVDLHDKNQS